VSPSQILVLTPKLLFFFFTIEKSIETVQNSTHSISILTLHSSPKLNILPESLALTLIYIICREIGFLFYLFVFIIQYMGIITLMGHLSGLIHLQFTYINGRPIISSQFLLSLKAIHGYHKFPDQGGQQWPSH